MDAVARGETIVQALQDAVPEDVRGKLTTAVTGILQSSGSKLNFENLNLPSLSPGSKKAEEARNTIVQKDSHSPDPKSKSDSMMSGLDNTSGSSENSGSGIELKHSPSESSQRDSDSGKSQPVDSDQDDSSVLTKKGIDEPGINLGNNEPSTNEKTSAADGSVKASEAKVDSTNQQPIGTENATSDDDKVDQGSIIPKRQTQEETDKNDEKEAPIANEKTSAANGFEKASDTKVDCANQGQPIGADNTTSDEDRVDMGIALAQQQKEEETNRNDDSAKQSATDQNKVASTGNEGDAGQSSASQPVEKEEDDDQKKEENDDQKKETKIMQPVSDQTKPEIQEPNESKFNVSQAFEALTGMDDSTQVAVNSVFGVLENMITQMEEEKKEENEISVEKNLKDEKNVTDEKISSLSEEQTSYKKEAECQTSSEISHDLACSVNETRKGFDDGKTTGVMNEKHLAGDETVIGKHLPKILPARTTDSVENSSHDGYLGEELSEEQIAKQLDLDTTTALMLDYNPEEGKWKLPDQQPEYLGNIADNAAASRDTHGNVQVLSSSVSNEGNIIEPSYVILDHEQEEALSRVHDAADNKKDGVNKSDEGCEELEHLIKVIVSDSLNVEVQRRMNSARMRKIESQLSRDIKMVADTLSFAVVYAEPTWTFKRNSKNSNILPGKVGKLHGDAVVRAISSAVQKAHFLRKVLPVGVVVGSVLAALRKYFDVSTTTDNAKRDVAMTIAQECGNNGATNVVSKKMSQKTKQNNSSIGQMMESGLQNIRNEPVMVGAVTAALGASAMLVQHENPQRDGIMSKSSEKASQHKESDKLDQSSVVASFAEKAMSIAGPAVPTKESGEVDQDRIVAMLADLGQRGGILKLVGKLALLWGGLRGAMSLTDKLIQFLHMDEWPLMKRAVGFVGMVLVLWSPVVIPLLPTLLQSWSTSTPSRVAELASVVGLYVAVFILVMLWGKRVRKYENPFRQYGLDFKASTKKQTQEFLKALAGGIIIVLLVQSINTLLGAAILSRPPYLPHPFDAMKWLKGCTQLLLLIVRGFTAATFVVLVEELVFRSWMPNEIAIDLGHHQSIIITGLIFALFQRSLIAIPGLWLLSLGLAGARERSQGNLIIPIGLRTGMIATSFVLHSGGFLTYNPSSPGWITGTRPLQPFSGVVGFVVSLALAVLLYPRHSPETKIQKHN